MRILLVSQMWPGPRAPELGVFVRRMARELETLGHELEPVVLDRVGGPPTRWARLCAQAVVAARRFRPDAVYGHFLFPAGLAAALAARAAGARLVVTAHGRDVRNIGTIPGVRAGTRAALARADAVVCVSDYLRRELVAKLPEVAGRTAVVDMGVDLERFRGRDAAAARAAVGWEAAGPRFLCVGALDERKNVVRLADAFARLGEGGLAFVGDGPLRPRLEGRTGVLLAGRVPHERVADWIAASDVVCQPSLVEPFGQALLEALASERPVLATRVGGPPEFVPPGAGVLVEPGSVDALADGLRTAAALPSPNPEARAAAARHDVRDQARRIAALLAGGAE